MGQNSCLLDESNICKTCMCPMRVWLCVLCVCVCVCVCLCVQRTTAETGVMRRVASTPAPTTSSAAPAADASQTTGPATGTTTVATSAMRIRPVEAPQPVREMVLVLYPLLQRPGMFGSPLPPGVFISLSTLSMRLFVRSVFLSRTLRNLILWVTYGCTSTYSL